MIYYAGNPGQRLKDASDAGNLLSERRMIRAGNGQGAAVCVQVPVHADEELSLWRRRDKWFDSPGEFRRG